MIVRIAVAGALVGAIALALHHPAPRSTLATASLPAPSAALPVAADSGRPSRARRAPPAGDIVVYVAGAVRRPGLYHLHPGDRFAQAVDLAGGLTPQADAAGVNLAQPANDGDEVDVASAGEPSPSHSHRQLKRPRHRALPPPEASIDINTAGADALGAVPGIGRAIGARVVEFRERDGAFTSVDQLLDVAGMSQGRLERARPYLRGP